MHIHIEAQPDRRRFAAAIRHRNRGLFWAVRLLGAAMAVLGLLVAAMDRLSHAGLWPVGLASAGIGVLVALLVPGWLLRNGLRSMPKTLLGPNHIELTDESVKSSSALHGFELNWAAVVGVEEIPGQLLLLTGPRQFFVVPTDGLSGAELAELRAHIASRHLLTPV